MQVQLLHSSDLCWLQDYFRWLLAEKDCAPLLYIDLSVIISVIYAWLGKINGFQIITVIVAHVTHSELDMDWIHPWIGLDWVQFLGKKIGLDWIGLGQKYSLIIISAK